MARMFLNSSIPNLGCPIGMDDRTFSTMTRLKTSS